MYKYLNLEGAMELYELFGFVTVLSESVKLLPKNGKLMGFIAVSSVFLSSGLFLLFNYSLQSLVDHMNVHFQQSFMPDPSSFNVPDPTSFSTADPSSFTPQPVFNPAQITGQLNQTREFFALLFAVQILYILAIAIISFFSSIATVLVSSVSYSAKTFSMKDLFLRIGTTWTGPMITTFYVSGIAIGYHVLFAMLIAPLLIYPSSATYWVAISIGIVAFVIYIYLFVAWALAIVVSVVEESCYGMEALGKAGALVKGKRVHGFLINICFNLVCSIIFLVYYKVALVNKGLANSTLYGLFIVNVTFLVQIFLVVAYTVLYFQCKKHHGEEIELHGRIHYTKLPTTQLANDMP